MRSFILSLSLALTAAVLAPGTALASEGCYICKSGSSGACQQCRYGARDTSEARKACERRGCKVGGTKSCSTAANAKTCALPTGAEPLQTASLDAPACAAN